MKKIAYQTPEVKVKTLFMESLMAGSGLTGSGGATIGNGGTDTDGELEPTAKDGFNTHSVWDD